MGGGGGGGTTTQLAGLVGTDGINSGGNGSNTGTENGGNGAPNTGSGGGGAGYNGYSEGNGGKGGSGIVIIKFKTIVNTGIPEGNPITHKTLTFTHTPSSITYNFTNYNTKTTWEAYAATIPNFTYFFNYWFDPTYGANDIFAAAGAVGYIQMTLPSGYNNVSVFYGQGTLSAAVNDVRL